MHNLNLYSYYDKSLADVNREYLESIKNKPKRVSRKKWDKKVALAIAITLATGVLIANFLGVFSKKVVEVVETPPPPDTRTEEEKQGYVQIQIFEFAETPVETIKEPAIKESNLTIKEETKQIVNNKQAISTNDKNENKSITEKEQKHIVENVTPIKQAQQSTTKKAPVTITKKYSILFENIDENQYNKVKNISEKNNTKLEVVDVYSNTYSIWKVYEKSENGNEIFGLDTVHHIEDFLTQDDAIEYAKNRNIDALIRQVGITEKTYTVKLCCAEIENAKQIAQNSNITDRIIKIVRAE